jgi:hypothetical protein
MTYGIRWNGEWGSIGYSFAYMKTFNPAPVVNPHALGATGSNRPDVASAVADAGLVGANGGYYAYYGLMGATET